MHSSTHTRCCPVLNWHILHYRLANKQDLKDAMDESEINEQLQIEQLVNSHKCDCKIVSGTLMLIILLNVTRSGLHVILLAKCYIQ